jgi:hypothetical protein
MECTLLQEQYDQDSPMSKENVVKQLEKAAAEAAKARSTNDVETVRLPEEELARLH